MEYPKVNENKTPDSKVDDSKKKKETPNKRTKYLVICGYYVLSSNDFLSSIKVHYLGIDKIICENITL